MVIDRGLIHSGHGTNTRRTQDSRVCTAVCDTAAVGTIVWNPWKPPAQMWSSALLPASQIPLAKATASSPNTSALPASIEAGSAEVVRDEAVPFARGIWEAGGRPDKSVARAGAA